jgi:hypothetical protein
MEGRSNDNLPKNGELIIAKLPVHRNSATGEKEEIRKVGPFGAPAPLGTVPRLAIAIPAPDCARLVALPFLNLLFRQSLPGPDRTLVLGRR